MWGADVNALQRFHIISDEKRDACLGGTFVHAIFDFAIFKQVSPQMFPALITALITLTIHMKLFCSMLFPLQCRREERKCRRFDLVGSAGDDRTTSE
uniref:Bm8163 n=1 Tax=Brugia malayi TaxID=6279 RepID=A0A1I9FZU8_BRUMA|nr:Bm8163 [Brugia malayi]